VGGGIVCIDRFVKFWWYCMYLLTDLTDFDPNICSVPLKTLHRLSLNGLCELLPSLRWQNLTTRNNPFKRAFIIICYITIYIPNKQSIIINIIIIIIVNNCILLLLFFYQYFKRVRSRYNTKSTFACQIPVLRDCRFLDCKRLTEIALHHVFWKIIIIYNSWHFVNSEKMII
jgi:hypothetical protein